MIKLTNIFLSFSALGPLSILGTSSINNHNKSVKNQNLEYANDNYARLFYTHNSNYNDTSNRKTPIKKEINFLNSFSVTPDKNNLIKFTKDHPNNKIDIPNNNDDGVVLNPRFSWYNDNNTSSPQNSICGNYYTHINHKMYLQDLINNNKIEEIRTKLIETAPYFSNGDNPNNYHYTISLQSHYSYFIDFHNNSTIDNWNSSYYYPEIWDQNFPECVMFVGSSFGSLKDFTNDYIGTDVKREIVTDFWTSSAEGIYNGLAGRTWSVDGNIGISNFQNNFVLSTNFNSINLSLSDNFYYHFGKINQTDGNQQFEIIATNVDLSIDSIVFSWHHN